MKRLKDKLQETSGKGVAATRSADRKKLTPMLRGWVQYFRLAEVKGVFEDLDDGCGASCAASSGGSGNVRTPERRT